jgi:uncharacterized protein (UPF0332 family)
VKASGLIDKAERAAASARILLDQGDIDGACNRAYYAMFDAARAALLASRSPARSESTRTHSGLIAAFSLELVKTGRVDAELGRALNKAAEVRLIADYMAASVSREVGEETVANAERFVAAMRRHFGI